MGRRTRAIYIMTVFSLATAGVLTPILADTPYAEAQDRFDEAIAWIDFGEDAASAPGTNQVAPYAATGLLDVARERGLEGVALSLLDATATEVATTTTTADGTYTFDVADGDYTLVATAPVGYTFAAAAPTGDHELTDDPAPEPGQRETARATVTVSGGDADWPAMALAPLADLTVAHTDTDPDLDGVQAIQTGLSPFDTTATCPSDPPAPGDDCGGSDLYLRTNDLASMTVSVVADDIDSDMATLDGVVLEQHIVPSAGAHVDYAFDPALGVAVSCQTGGAALDSQILARPGGGWILLCDLGSFELAELKIVTSTLRADGSSLNGTTFEVTSRAYAAADDANPSAEIATGAITISAAPMLDLTLGESAAAKNQVFEQNAVTNKINPVSGLDELGKVFYYDVSILAGGSGRGTAPVGDPMTFTFELDPAYPGAQLHECLAGAFDNGGTSPLPGDGAGNPTDRQVADPGTWTCAYDEINHTIDVTITGADTTGTHYPTDAISGQTLGDSHFVATGNIRVWYPLSSFYVSGDPGWTDGDPPVDGNYPITACVSDFSPRSTDDSQGNFLGAEEPDYGESDGDPAAAGENCRTHSLIVSTAEVVFGTRFGHGDLLNNGSAVELWPCNGRLMAGQSGCDSGDGAVLPGDRTVIEVEGKNRSGVATVTDQVLCAAIDNSLAHLDATTTGPLAGQFAIAQFFSPDIPGGFAPADMDDWIIEYGRFAPLAGQLTWNVDHVAGPADPITGFVPADVSALLAATEDCGAALETAGTLVFSETPVDVDGVVMVRLRPRTADGVLKAGQDINLYVPIRTRSTVHGDFGQPQVGDAIGTGWLLPTVADYGRYGLYVDHAYDVVTHTGGHIGSVSHGDRLVFDQLRLDVDLKASTMSVEPGTDDADAVLAGDTLMWTIVPEVTSRASGTVSDVQVSVALPDALFFDPLCSPGLPAGVGGPLIDVVDGMTVLTFDLGDRRTEGALPEIDFCTGSNPFALGEEAAVEATILSTDVRAPEASRQAQRATRLLATGGLSVFKFADAVIDTPGQAHVWTLQWGNTSEHLVIDAIDLIDVLPWNGDGDGSASERNRLSSGFGGDLQLAGVPANPTRSTDGGDPTTESGTWFFTAAESSTVDHNPLAASNGSGGATRWCELAEFGLGGCPSSLGDVTAVRFISADTLAPLSVVSAELTIATVDGPRPATLEHSTSRAVFVNRFVVHSPTFASQQIRSNEAWVQVVAYSLGDLLYVDMDENGAYNASIDLPAPAGIVIELYDDGDVLRAITTTDEFGRWRFDGLADGDYYVRIPATEFTGDLTGWTAAPGAGTNPDADADERSDHHAIEDPTVVGAIRSAGTIRLSSTLTPGGQLMGNEPLAEDTEPSSLLERDDLSNFTLDLALIAPTGLEIDVAVCDEHLDTTCATDDATVWVDATTVRPGDPVVLRVEVTNAGAVPLNQVWVDSSTAASCSATGDGAALPETAPANGDTAPAQVVEGLRTLEPGTTVVYRCTVADIEAAGSLGLVAGTTLATGFDLLATDAVDVAIHDAAACRAVNLPATLDAATWSAPLTTGTVQSQLLITAAPVAVTTERATITISTTAVLGDDAVLTGVELRPTDPTFVPDQEITFAVRIGDELHPLVRDAAVTADDLADGVHRIDFDTAVHLDPAATHTLYAYRDTSFADDPTLDAFALLGGFCEGAPPVPELRIETAANPVDAGAPTVAEDADDAPGRYVSGENVRFTSLVTTDGHPSITAVAVDSDLGSFVPVLGEDGEILGDTAPFGQLDPGEAWRFELITPLTGAISLTTTVTGEAGSLGLLTDHDDTHVDERLAPEIDVWIALNPVDPTTPTDYEFGTVEPGPVVDLGADITWSMGVSLRQGDDLEPAVVVHDAGTPNDPSDDFTPEPLLDAEGVIVGDLDADGLLDRFETWVYLTPIEHRTTALDDPATWLATVDALVVGPTTIGIDGQIVAGVSAIADADVRHVPVAPAITMHSFYCSAGSDAVGSSASCEEIEAPEPVDPPEPAPACFSGLYQIVDGELRRFDPLSGELTWITPDDVAPIDGLNAMGFSQPLGGFYGMVNRATDYPKGTVIRVNLDGTTESLGIPAGLRGSSYSGDVDDRTGTDLWVQQGSKGVFWKIDLLTMTAEKVTFAARDASVSTSVSADMVWVDGVIYSTGKDGALNVFDPETLTRWKLTVDGLPNGPYGAMWNTAGGELYVFRNKNGAVYRIDGYDTE
ncbi:MAG: SdrD B-like domain-containing protein, partial [Actinomycetota bacterium]